MDDESNSSSSSNEFSRENMIGMFLALQLCQLTQPYGSLLFCRDGGGGGFFWRCDPIASLVEGLIIFRYLGAAIWEARREPWAVVFLRLQAMAAALLLTRSGAAAATANDSTGQTAPSDEDMLEKSFENASILEHEAQRAQRRMVRGAFGANTLAHRELRFDVVTTVAALLILIKLMTVSGIFMFTIAGVSMFVGWVAVQVLLILLHIRQMEDPEITAAGRIAVGLDRTILQDVKLWRLLFFCLHLPVLGHPAYVAASRRWFPGETDSARLGRDILSLAGLAISFISALFTFVWGAGGSLVWLQDRRLFPMYSTIRMSGRKVIGLVPLWSWWTGYRPVLYCGRGL